MIVAAAQTSIDITQNSANLSRTLADIKTAAELGAKLVVLPELSNSGYCLTKEESTSCAEKIDGETIGAWQLASSELSIIIVAGFCEMDENNKVRNSAVIIDRGNILGVYRKVHLWDKEPDLFLCGEKAPLVVDTSIGRIAVMVCYDIEFPEWVRMAAIAGAEVLALPTNWPSSPKPSSERSSEIFKAQAAAATNRMWVIAADRSGEERGLVFQGASMILDLDGYPVVGPVGNEAKIITAEIDFSAARNKTIIGRANVFTDRKNDLYKI